MLSSNYPNLLEVYKSADGDYLVVDRTLQLESYYYSTVEESIDDLTDDLYLTRNPYNKNFHSYYYQGNHYTLAELQQLYPELLL